MPNAAIVASAAAGSGRFILQKPQLSYEGSGTSNNGRFSISNYNPSFIYSMSGNGYISNGIVIINNANSSVSITVKSPKGVSSSTPTTAERKNPDQGSYSVTTGPFECHSCSAPQGHAAPCCAPGPCGCGTFHVDLFLACCAPGYTVYFWNNYSSLGYNWGGNDYTNGSGEWWKII